MADLSDPPTSLPIASAVSVCKPENQGTINKSNGSRIIRLNIPDYVKYWLPSQSNFSYELTMQGRGQPIPSRDAGHHSMWSRVISHNGAGNALLESVDQYSTYVAQCWNYDKSEATQNFRGNFEGLQGNESSTNNIYWAQAGSNWTQGPAGITTPDVPRNVQIVSTLKTKLYDSDQYIPCQCLGGIRLELQLENYERALEYTTGSLAIGANNKLPAYPLAIKACLNANGTRGVGQSNLPLVGGEPLVQAFGAATIGAGSGTPLALTWVADAICPFAIGGATCGIARVLAVAGTPPLPTHMEVTALGDPTNPTKSAKCPQQGDVIQLGYPMDSSSYMEFPVNEVMNCFGSAVLTAGQNICLPMWASYDLSTGAGPAPGIVGQAHANILASAPPPGPGSAASGNTGWWNGDLRDPARNMTRRAVAPFPSTNLNCFPECINPFSIGDKVNFCHVDNSNAVELGAVVGIRPYAPVAGDSGMPELVIKPNRAPLNTGDWFNTTAFILGATLTMTSNEAFFLGTAEYGFTHKANGLGVFLESADRINGWLPKLPDGSTWATGDPNLEKAMAQQVDFTLANFQYQVKEVYMPEGKEMEDMKATQSDAGLQIDLETVQTRLVNLAQITGPTSQLISIPQVTRALATMGVPLDQNQQRGLEYKSLRGVPDQMTNYQYSIGSYGLQPNRPVPVQLASLGNPLVQAQEVNEKIKACEGFGINCSNLNHVGMNFSVSRQFSRQGMYFNLFNAGDLVLKAQFNNPQTSPKLYVHFINHLRSINISRDGTQIMN